MNANDNGQPAPGPGHDGGEGRPLWAPWRYEYVKAPDRDACFFCTYAAMPADDEENLVIARGVSCFVVLNRYPYNPGHVMVTPYRHVNDLLLLTLVEREEMFALMVRVRLALNAVMRPHGLNIGANLGRAAGAAIEDHLHWHLVPRWFGDTNFMPVLAKTDCMSQALGDTARLLRAAWADTADAAIAVEAEARSDAATATSTPATCPATPRSPVATAPPAAASSI